MSYTFSVPASPQHAIAAQAILADLRPDQLVYRHAFDANGDWPLGYTFVHRHGASVRAVEVLRDDDGVHVRIMACSNEADHRLALALVRRVAVCVGGLIEPEFSDPVTLDVFDEDYDDAWVVQSVLSGPRSIAAIVQLKNEVMTMPGAVRLYHLGPRHLATLQRAGPSEELGARMLADMHRVQHLDLTDVHVPDVMQVGEGPDRRTFVVIGPGTRCLLPKVDEVSLFESEERSVVVPRSQVQELLSLDLIDECQAFVQSVPACDWGDVLAKAREITGQEAPPKRPWWKVW